jgi:hypothetical protein
VSVASDESETKSRAGRSSRAELIGLVLAISLPAGLLTLWATPRAARPAEMPALVLPAPEVARAIADQDALAADAVDDEMEANRRRLYLASGLAEVRMDATQEEFTARAAGLAQLARTIAARDPHALAAARARDVTRMLPALRGEGHLTATERASEMGVFPQMLERYGAIVDGRRIASELVIRTNFMGRWNVMHGLPPTDGMSQLERRAYYGWLALEGGAAPLSMRVDAVEAYAAAGGTRVWEARGVLAYESGELAQAHSDFEHAYELTGSLRLRNHALAALGASEGVEAGDAEP